LYNFLPLEYNVLSVLEAYLNLVLLGLGQMAVNLLPLRGFVIVQFTSGVHD
jgi:hypothetical protein